MQANNNNGSATIDLWLFEQPQDGEFAFSDLLLANQQQKLPNLHINKQSEYGYTRLLLNHIARQSVRNGKAALSESLVIEDQAGLPPHIPALNEQSIIFSISHSAALIGIAVAQVNENSVAKLGLDIELINIRRRLSAARLFCSQDQLETLNKQPSQDSKINYFTQLWTQKEAYFKAQHKAVLNPDLKALDISDSNTDKTANMQSTLWTTSQGKHYQISVCNNLSADINVCLATVNTEGEISKKPKRDVVWQPFHATIK